MKRKIAIGFAVVLTLVFGICISRFVQYNGERNATCNVSVSNKSQNLSIATLTEQMQKDNLLNKFYQESGQSGHSIKQFRDEQALINSISPERAPEFDIIVDLNEVVANEVKPCSFASAREKWAVEKWSLFVDEKYFSDHQLPEIKSSLDLRKPNYKNLTILPDWKTDSGRAFFLTTVSRLGDLSWQNYWKDLNINAVELVDDVDEMSFQQFGNPDADPKKFPIALLPDEYSSLLQGAKKIEGSTISEVKEAVVMNNTSSVDSANKFIEYLKGINNLDADVENSYSDEVAAKANDLIIELTKVLQN